MRTVFMGTPEFAVPSLHALSDAGYDIKAVVTQPDRRGNRGKMTCSPVKTLALELGYEVLQPERIRKNEEFIDKLRSLEPELIVVAAFGQILPREVLDMPKYGCINVHGSLLPKLRGAAPMQQAIAMGLDTTGVTIMQMAEGLDTGDMISKIECDIRGLDITEVADLLSKSGAKLLVDTIPAIVDGSAKYESQNDEESSYARQILKTDGLTGFDEPAAVIECKIRAYKEWPVVHTYYDGKQVKIYEACACDDTRDGQVEPGCVVDVEKNSFAIKCAEGKLVIKELQLQGKKRMGAGDFMRGTRIGTDSRFTKEV